MTHKSKFYQPNYSLFSSLSHFWSNLLIESLDNFSFTVIQFENPYFIWTFDIESTLYFHEQRLNSHYFHQWFGTVNLQSIREIGWDGTDYHHGIFLLNDNQCFFLFRLQSFFLLMNFYKQASIFLSHYRGLTRD